MSQQRNLRELAKRYGPLGLVIPLVATNSVFTVKKGERAIVYHRLFGIVLRNSVGEGLHLRLPILHKPVIFYVLNRPHSFSTVSYTKDFGNLKLSYRIIYLPDASKLVRIIKTLGDAYEDKFLPLIGEEGHEILKKILRDIDIQQLPMERSRSNVSAYLLNELNTRASEFNIIIEDVQITNMSYSYQVERCIHYSDDDDNNKNQNPSDPCFWCWFFFFILAYIKW